MPRLRAHLSIARLDPSIKNIFVLHGIVVPLSVNPGLFNLRLVSTLLLAFVAITFVACCDYVINEVLDARFDRLHPEKLYREPQLMAHFTATALAMSLLLFIRISQLEKFFPATPPPSPISFAVPHVAPPGRVGSPRLQAGDHRAPANHG